MEARKCLGNDCNTVTYAQGVSNSIILDNAYFYIKTYGGVGQQVIISGANGYLYLSPGALNDAIACKAYLPAGQFRLLYHYQQNNTNGTISIYINGVVYLNSLNTRGGATLGKVNNTLITIPAEGEYEVEVRVVATGGAGFDINMSHIAFVPV